MALRWEGTVQSQADLLHPNVCTKTRREGASQPASLPRRKPGYYSCIQGTFTHTRQVILLGNCRPWLIGGRANLGELHNMCAKEEGEGDAQHGDFNLTGEVKTVGVHQSRKGSVFLPFS